MTRRVLVMVTATVRWWSEEEGWGVLDSPEIPGGCFGHYSNIQMTGFRALSPGQQVNLTWEAPRLQTRRLRLPSGEHCASAGLTS